MLIDFIVLLLSVVIGDGTILVDLGVETIWFSTDMIVAPVGDSSPPAAVSPPVPQASSAQVSESGSDIDDDYRPEFWCKACDIGFDLKTQLTKHMKTKLHKKAARELYEKTQQLKAMEEALAKLQVNTPVSLGPELEAQATFRAYEEENRFQTRAVVADKKLDEVGPEPASKDEQPQFDTVSQKEHENEQPEAAVKAQSISGEVKTEPDEGEFADLLQAEEDEGSDDNEGEEGSEDDPENKEKSGTGETKMTKKQKKKKGLKGNTIRGRHMSSAPGKGLSKKQIAEILKKRKKAAELAALLDQKQKEQMTKKKNKRKKNRN